MFIIENNKQTKKAQLLFVFRLTIQYIQELIKIQI